MILIVEIVLPVFFLIGIGYGLAAKKYLSSDHIDGLTKYTQGFALPVLLFLSIAQADLTLFSAKLYLGYYAPAFVIFLGATLGAKYLLGRETLDAVVIGFGALFSNSVLLGLPIMERAYGAESLDINFALIAVHVPFCYLLGILTMEILDAGEVSVIGTLKVVLKRIFSIAIMIGILLGLAANLINLPISGVFKDSLALIAQTALPVALVGLGGILVRYRLQDHIGQTLYILIISMVIFPALVWGYASWLGLPLQTIKSSTLMAAMAPGINIFIFATLYDRAKGVCASAVVLGTGLALVTISIWLAVLG
ncbi:MAG: AEC family transporter [Pseudomonadota bacterium]